jgi:hypothetical protein
MINLKEKKMKMVGITIHFHPEPTQPHSPTDKILPRKKEGGRFVLYQLLIQRFLSIRINTKPMAMIATIVPIDIGRK